MPPISSHFPTNLELHYKQKSEYYADTNYSSNSALYKEEQKMAGQYVNIIDVDDTMYGITRKHIR